MTQAASDPFADPRPPGPKDTPRAKAKAKAKEKKPSSATITLVRGRSGEDNPLYGKTELGFAVSVKGMLIEFRFDKKTEALTFNKQQATFLVDQLNAHKKLLK